ncbi:hypothetical protein BV898_16395 [Hypsibius exemplaris]|uniref:Uncharacterized protein n=1 Tax=Hypsibius exemplaris TaxID=2072580 RepID=A0A9X6RLF8_HYPEX|nr:hypothetical protein BV898_16395 [Hypsibius exemplaris]
MSANCASKGWVTLIKASQATVCVLFLLSCAGASVLEISSTLQRSVLAPLHNTSDPFFVVLIQNMWNCSYSLRAVLVLALFASQPTAWHALHANIHTVFSHLETNTERSTKYLRFLALLSFLLTFTVHSITVILSWFRQEGWLNRLNYFHYLDLGTRNGTSCYLYFDICISLTSSSTFWTVLVDVPFVLSQQVLLCALIFAVKLLMILKKLKAEISELTSDLEVSHEISRWKTFHAQVKKWTRVYVTCQRFLYQFNSFFGRILLLSVTLDVFTTLGLGANLVAPAKGTTSLVTSGYYVFLCGIYLSYATLLFIPFVLVHEESKEIDRHLRVLSWTIEGHFMKHTDEDWEFNRTKNVEFSLDKLVAIVQTNTLTVEAGGLFTFSKSLLVTTLATVATLLVVTQEILDRSVSGTVSSSICNCSIFD